MNDRHERGDVLRQVFASNAGDLIWRELIYNVAIDWKALHDDVQRLMSSGLSFATAFNGLPVGRYIQLAPPVHQFGDQRIR